MGVRIPIEFLLNDICQVILRYFLFNIAVGDTVFGHIVVVDHTRVVVVGRTQVAVVGHILVVAAVVDIALHHSLVVVADHIRAVAVVVGSTLVGTAAVVLDQNTPLLLQLLYL